MTFTRCMWPWKHFPNGSVGKESACNAGDTGDSGLIAGWARSPGRRNGNPLQYPCLENPVDRSWQATVHGVAKHWTRLMIIFGFFWDHLYCYLGHAGGLSGIKSTHHRRIHSESWAQSLVRKIPWRRAWQPSPVSLPGESHGQRSLACSLYGCTESDTTEAT